MLIRKQYQPLAGKMAFFTADTRKKAGPLFLGPCLYHFFAFLLYHSFVI